MRVALLGGFAFVLFAVVFFRLWFLQVLTGQDYVSQARDNRVRKVRIEAPRGDIVDRDGRKLVRTRIAPVVQVVPNLLPATVLDLADSYRDARSRRSGHGCGPRPAARAGARPGRAPPPPQRRGAPPAPPAQPRRPPRPPRLRPAAAGRRRARAARCTGA